MADRPALLVFSASPPVSPSQDFGHNTFYQKEALRSYRRMTNGRASKRRNDKQVQLDDCGGMERRRFHSFVFLDHQGCLRRVMGGSHVSIVFFMRSSALALVVCVSVLAPHLFE